MKITFLGPPGANFSDLARLKFADLLGQHCIKTGDFDLVKNNEHVLPRVINHGGLGVVAMETMAEGRYDGPVKSFVELLNYYVTSGKCPITVIAALKMRIHFALMTRAATQIEAVTEVLGHEKSHGACRKNIQARGWRFVDSTSNGQAAEDVALNPKFATAAALGPIEAAKKYRLKIFSEAFEDEPAVTTFYLLGPKMMIRNVGLREANMSVLVCRLLNRPLSLAKVLYSFGERGINLRYDNSVFVGGDDYDHVLHYHCRKDQKNAHHFGMQNAIRTAVMLRYVLLGPFPVL